MFELGDLDSKSSMMQHHELLGSERDHIDWPRSDPLLILLGMDMFSFAMPKNIYDVVFRVLGIQVVVKNSSGLCDILVVCGSLP